MTELFLGVDVGSVSTNIVMINNKNELLEKKYVRTMGNPIKVLTKAMKEIGNKYNDNQIKGVGTTGSGRNLANIILGADIIKNEITAHAIAGINFTPEVRTILEIGGQDSKIILIENGIITDFAMNTVCAAGTGSFLDRQSQRLGIEIQEFGDLAIKSDNPVRIAGRCAVFAESDMIHKQQLGHNQEDIINGLCEALVRNYLNNLAKSKKINKTILFQGGVAANKGIRKAFEKYLGEEIHIPEYYDVMGSIGAAILAKEKFKKTKTTNFRGFDATNVEYKVRGFECNDCPNMCEVVEIIADDKILARWQDKCGKYSNYINSDDNLA
ncbi:2-hydroxyglutaryl-CoA dehydratase [Clostridium sp. D2Q-14]|uniref:acyl-CoA dehydratase activase n=1 Tax=Anaeromonas gelatinilytica TaxID=2683194 RepID=UPI00193B41A5|nr:acyl-CoA dehydratase activase [Anaeromonas gelatinilytica]MBS4534576.1 2-hydroxyglutaryl-CoA dehydratase [Anaeromonas gelatinilytica]